MKPLMTLAPLLASAPLLQMTAAPAHTATAGHQPRDKAAAWAHGTAHSSASEPPALHRQLWDQPGCVVPTHPGTGQGPGTHAAPPAAAEGTIQLTQ